MAAAYTDVEGAQTDIGKAIAHKLNVHGTKIVAEETEKEGKFLAYISTCFVFLGTHNYPGPYFSYAKTAELNSPLIGEYARTKLQGEQIIRYTLENYGIFRISYPLGNYNSSKDFARKTIDLIERGYPLWKDQVLTPTHLSDLAAKIMQVDSEEMTGIFHVVRWPPTTPYEIGKFIFDNYKINADEIKGGLMEKYMIGRTLRPLKGGLVPTERKSDIKDWRNAVDETIYSFYPRK